MSWLQIGVLVMKIVNIFGGPGIGKSTACAGVFAELKLRGINCEMVTEFAKDLTWEQRVKTMQNQFYITAKQYHRFWRLKGQVDIVVTDSPLLTGLFYAQNEPKEFENLIFKKHNEFKNINFLLNRKKKYLDKGRSQTEQEAIDIDEKIRLFLTKNGIYFYHVNGNRLGTETIVETIEAGLINGKLLE